ncbi:MAG: hypothetical protein ACK56I_33520, partial [bacterium]
DVAFRNRGIEVDQLCIKSCTTVGCGQVSRILRFAIEFVEILPSWQQVVEERTLGGGLEIGGDLEEFRFGLGDRRRQPSLLAGRPIAPEVILPTPGWGNPIHIQRATDAVQPLQTLAKIRCGPTREAMEGGQLGKWHGRPCHPHRGALA